MKKTQEHLLGIAAIADDRSPYINEHLPVIIAAHQAVMDATEGFFEGLWSLSIAGVIITP